MEGLVKHPIDLIRRSSWFDLLMLGLLLTPGSLLAWTKILEFAQTPADQRGAWTLSLALVHLMAIAAMMLGSQVHRKRYRTLTLILGYLVSKNFMMVSFERIREKYGDEFTDNYLMSVIKEFPQYLRVGRLKNGKKAAARLTRDVGLPPEPDEPGED